MRTVNWILAIILILALAIAGFWLGGLGQRHPAVPSPASSAPDATPSPPVAVDSATVEPPSLALQPLADALASADPAVRSAAQRQLANLPLDSRNDLHMLVENTVNSEVGRLLSRRLEEMDLQIAFDPPPISLHLHNARLGELVSALAAATGADITPYFDLNPNATYSIDADHKPFWEIFAQLDAQSPLALYGRNDSFKIYTALPNRQMQRKAIHGPFLLYTIPTRPASNAASAGNPVSDNTITWEFAADPRTAALGILLTWTAIDATGKEYDIPLTDRPFSAGRFSPIADRVGPTGTFSLPVASIVAFRIHARIDVGANYVSAEIKDVEKHLETPIPVGNAIVTIDQIDSKQPDGFYFQFAAKDSNSNLVVYDSYRFYDATGKLLQGISGKGGGGTGSNAKVTGPFTLQVRVPQQVKTFEFDFDMK